MQCVVLQGYLLTLLTRTLPQQCAPKYIPHRSPLSATAAVALLLLLPLCCCCRSAAAAAVLAKKPEYAAVLERMCEPERLIIFR
jgi:hypothetical protein